MTAPKRKPTRNMMKPWRVQSGGAGDFDEIVVGNPSWLHVEAMNDTCAWVRIGERVFDVFRERGKLVVREREENDR